MRWFDAWLGGWAGLMIMAGCIAAGWWWAHRHPRKA